MPDCIPSSSLPKGIFCTYIGRELLFDEAVRDTMMLHAQNPDILFYMCARRIRSWKDLFFLGLIPLYE